MTTVLSWVLSRTGLTILLVGLLAGYLGITKWQLRGARSERDATARVATAAIHANQNLSQQLISAAEAHARHQQQLDALRVQHDRKRQHLRSAPSDGCLDAPLPPDVRGLLDDPGAGVDANGAGKPGTP